MGELILCGQPLAAVPFYLEDAGINVYSLEELSYYIENNVYLLETDFMSEELCAWLEKELGLTDLAERLRQVAAAHGTLADFVMTLLAESGYCSVKCQRQIAQTLQEMEHKSEFECGKLRADRYQENGKYLAGIMEYRKLLEMEEKNTILVGDVWHNMGNAYARLFLFAEAADCFREAYARNQNPESMRECLYAYRLAGDEGRYTEMAQECRLGEEELLDIAKRVGEAEKSGAAQYAERELEEWFAAGDEGRILAKLDEWTGQYRKNCRI